jgi:ribosomal protein L37AE/L43A
VWEPGKPSRNEDEYFARQDANWIKERRAALDAERAARSQQKMNCPRCNGRLGERAFHGVRIDVCENCGGVWLDTGELEMVAEAPREEVLRMVREIDAERRTK